MTHERLDHGCRANVLAVTGNEVLIDAFWPATDRDKKNFSCQDGIARNAVCVSKQYFERRYGVKL